MNTVLRLLELLLVLGSVVYSSVVTDQLLKVTSHAAYLQGKFDMMENWAAADNNPKKLPKW